MNEKAELLASFQEWINFLRKLSEQNELAWNEPISPGKWSLRAVVSHIMLWDQYFFEHAIDKIHKQLPLTLKHTDYDDFNRNAQSYGEQVSIEELIRQSIFYRERIIAAIQSLSEELYEQEYVDGDGRPFFVA